MIVVSPYRPFEPESREHQALGAFDWIDAVRMLGTSVSRACGCPMLTLTDEDTDLPVPSLRYRTKERRLMLWILEVSLRFLESADFDQDTVLISPDSLVYHDLRPWFLGDLTVVIRPSPKYVQRPLLNGLQWWKHRAKPQLITFYRTALRNARTLPEDIIRWGADTQPIVDLIAPIAPGLHERAGLEVVMLPRAWVLETLSADMVRQLEEHTQVDPPTVPVMDFRFLRKKSMRAYFDATVPA